jgi:hypothetical protein
LLLLLLAREEEEEEAPPPRALLLFARAPLDASCSEVDVVIAAAVVMVAAEVQVEVRVVEQISGNSSVFGEEGSSYILTG